MAETLVELVDSCAFLAIKTLHPLRELGERGAQLLRGRGTGSDFPDRPAQFDQFVVSLRAVDCAQARGERVHRPCKRFGLMRMLGDESRLAAMIVDDQRADAGAEGGKR